MEKISLKNKLWCSHQCTLEKNYFLQCSKSSVAISVASVSSEHSQWSGTRIPSILDLETTQKEKWKKQLKTDNVEQAEEQAEDKAGMTAHIQAQEQEQGEKRKQK